MTSKALFVFYRRSECISFQHLTRCPQKLTSSSRMARIGLTKNKCLVLFAIGYIILTVRLSVWHQGCIDQLNTKTTSSDQLNTKTNNEVKTDNEVKDEKSLREVDAADDPEKILKPSSGNKEFVIETYDHKTLLDVKYVSNTVHYVWCGKRWFEFHHYLSMKSVLREIQPDLIIFHHDYLPILDEWLYNTWFDDLRDEFPFLFLRAAYPQEKLCLDHKRPNPEFINAQLTERGGIYVNEHTMMLRFPIEFKEYDYIKGRDSETGFGFLLARRGFPGNRSLSNLLQNSNIKTRYMRCISYTSITTLKTNKYVKTPMCMNIDKTIYPKDIWMRDDEFGRVTRRVFYGSPEIPKAQPKYDTLIPNIAHMVWLGGGRMDFLFYLSVLSLLHVVEVEALYIHGDAPPSGPYWERVKDHPRLHHIFREAPHTVYGTRVKVLSHVTDIWRVDFMIKYGGIYVDTDTAFVKPLDKFIRAFDAVASYDWTYWNHPFPDTINFGVTSGKKNATYWQHFQKSMTWFRDEDWAWNGLRRPYKLQEKYPQLIRLDPHFQVICFEYKCHPTWHPEYHNESIHHLNTNSIKDWRNDVYAFHWTLPTPPELMNESALIRSTTMFAEIGRFILEKAGVDIKKYIEKR